LEQARAGDSERVVVCMFGEEVEEGGMVTVCVENGTFILTISFSTIANE
jgi:hypothetical protein